jgi:hypothetical protein
MKLFHAFTVLSTIAVSSAGVPSNQNLRSADSGYFVGGMDEAVRAFISSKSMDGMSDKLKATLTTALSKSVSSGKLSINKSSSYVKSLEDVTGDVFVGVKVYDTTECGSEVVEFAIFDLGAFCVQIDGGAQVFSCYPRLPLLLVSFLFTIVWEYCCAVNDKLFTQTLE